ncbi:MAG: V-type ATP synthase subunit I [Patescibacteria group bacterium]|nr:V-type ATP synthase subunit I [Patescibacteria group bacterium]
MAVSPIQKICLVGHVEHQEKIIETIYQLGWLEIISNKDLENQEDQYSYKVISDLDYKLAQIKSGVDFIEQYKPKEKNWQKKINNLLNPKIPITQTKINKILSSFDYQDLVEKTQNLNENLNQCNNLIIKYQSEIKILEPWQDLIYPPQSIQDTQKTISTIGIINKKHFDLFLQEIEKDKDLIEVINIKEDEKENYILIIYFKTLQKEIDELFKKFDFQHADLIYPNQKPKETIQHLQKEIIQAEKKQQEILHQIQDLGHYLDDLKIVYDYFFWQKEKMIIDSQITKTQHTFGLSAWIESRHVENLKKILNKISSETEIVKIELEKNETPPVVLRNSNFVQPFESVTNIYGAPQSHEVDPTPYLAPFFIIFFGLCLSDAGYGIILALFSFLAMKVLKTPKEKRGFFKLLIYGGVATFIMGAILGGWFGITLENLPASLEPIRNFLLKIRIINPVEEPLKMLVVSLILGIIQVVVGIAVNLYWNLKNKDWDQSFDSAIWLYFIFSILFWMLTKVGLIASLSQLATYLVYLGVAAVVLTQGRRAKNIFLKIPQGILSLYDLVGYLSDVLSYSRILALGLATGIIAMVINLIAMLFKDMIPFIGWPIAILILIGGHIFNLAINALGSFIHSGRLQYVEFFPKFMEGGGRRFKPVKKQGQFTTPENQN